jgi:hypothetical protein
MFWICGRLKHAAKASIEDFQSLDFEILVGSITRDGARNTVN